ncbi:hypothetical protein ACFXGA_33810 [Actinosynnema sp. NPDC059335]|uniref:hypothetical protein n=1 Tax=Actinosynnema sp. NPDC059335 TaxID=3346804 RepID=UPI003671E125
MATGIGVAAVVLFSIPYRINRLFYYVGDNHESFVPLWHHLGERIRDGQWPLMDPAGWYGGNYAAEGEYSLWNPVQVADYVLVSLFDDLAAASALVMVQFLALISVGLYLLCREHGAGRVPSAVVALATPACGFSLYYAASGWPAEPMALAWVTWFWWSARRFARGVGTPLTPFVFGLLATTTGNPYAVLGMLVVLTGIAVELVVRGEYARLAQVLFTAACAGTGAVLLFLPLLEALEVTTRQGLAAVANDGFMVPHLGDLVASSSPTYLPPIVNWNGAVRESLPSTYFVWFAVPLLPWLRWRAMRAVSRPLLGVLVVAGVYLALVLGPSNLWLFRWPIRMIEHLYVAVAVLLAVALSAGLARDRLRVRIWGSAALVGVGAYLAVASSPEHRGIHFVATLLVVAFVAAAVVAHLRCGVRVLGAVLVTGTAAIMAFQVWRLPVEAGVPVEPPTSVAGTARGSAGAEGAVLQLATQHTVRTQDYAAGLLLFGNENILRGRETVNRYSGIGFAAFTDALCMDYKGRVCPEAFDRLWEVVDGTEVRLVDALRVRTLVLQRSLLPHVVDRPPPPGWEVVERGDVRVVWARQGPLPHPGRVAWASAGVEVRSAAAEPNREVVAYRAPEGGRVVFARVNWPGHSAAVEGSPGTVPVRTVGAGLIAVDLPPGEHVLRLSFEEPGLVLGFRTVGAGALLVLAQTLLWRRRRRKAAVPTW